MLRVDSKQHRPITPHSDDNFDSITVDVVYEIEKELLDSPYDIISLVFLLYDVPDTALQRLIVYERVSKDAYSTNLNLLHEWTREAKTKPTWKHEFLEALLVCQLYGIVRKMGFNVSSLKRQYQPDDIFVHMYINPIKKVLYKLCENIDSNNLTMLKKTLLTYQIDTMMYESCELVFLKLMSEKIITLQEFQKDKKELEYNFNFDKLVKIIQKLSGLETFANELRMLQGQKSCEPTLGQPVAASSPSSGPLSDLPAPQAGTKQRHADDLSELYEMINDLNIDDMNHIKSDSKNHNKDYYAIKDSKRIGVCLIINQEEFHLCDESIEDENLPIAQSKRIGSTLDKIQLERTMAAMNLDVIVGENLGHRELFNFIKRNIWGKVQNTDSVFMLCILSHGVRGHVFGADWVKVKVEDIQNLLDSDDALALRGIPKVMIIQACQVDDTPQVTLVADSPNPNYYLRKSDFLIYWATAPELKAFRDEGLGSIFIQLLCAIIQKAGKQEHLFDIFTKVNNAVMLLCIKHKCSQVPLFKSTLRKKLYLHIPE